nr:hypothetical protein [Tanacetum cinerariifolium]
MASFDYRLNPLYPIKEFSSCGALYTAGYCCSEGSLGDKIICDLDKTPDLSQRPPQNCPKCGNPIDGNYCQRCALLRKKFKEDLFTYCIENGSLQDSSEPSNDNTNVVNALQEPFVVKQDPSAHYGYNCPLKVPIVPNPEPFNNQTVDELPQTVPSFDPTCYSKDGNSFTYDSKSNLVHDSPNVFDPPPQPPLYSCEFCGNDAHFHDFQQQYLCCENCGVTHEAYQCQPMYEDYNHQQNSCYDPNSFGFDQFQPPQYTVNHPIFNAQNDLFNSQKKFMEQLTSMCDMVGQYIQKKEEEKKIEEEQAAKARYWKIPTCYDDDDDDYTITITHKEFDNSLSMGNEHLDTVSATESDEFIKSSVENLVPNPSEFEGEYECDVPACEVFKTFFNILFDADYDFSSDDQSFSDEDFLKKIYSNPLFDEEIISIKIDPHHFNAESDLIESLLNHDSLIISSSSKIDSLFDELADELTLRKSIPLGINKTDCDPEEEIRLIKRLLYDNSSPRPNEEFISENSDTAFESFSPSPILVEDSIEEDDYDSEKDILILEELLSNDFLSLHENELISTQPTLVPNQEKSPNLLSHQGHEAFQPSAECPMMIYGKNTPILDVSFFHFYPP